MEPSTNVGLWMSQILSYLVVTLGLAVLFKYLFTSSVPNNIPPFPIKGYPILGHLPYLKRGVREQMEKWQKSAGDIFSLHFGNKLVVILCGYDVVHEAYVKHGDTLSDRPASLSSNCPEADPNTGIATASGKEWKEQRTVIMHILRSFGFGKNIFALRVSEEVSAFINALSELSGQPSNVRILTRNAVSNIICSIIIGKRFEYDDDYFITFITKIEELSRLTQSSSLFTLFPWLRFIPGDLFHAKKRTQLQRYIMDFFCRHYIEKAKNKDEELNEDNFISAFLLEKEKLEEQGKPTNLDENCLARNILQLFFAGTDTTSTAIQWFMVYMLNYPDVQAKIFAEISDVVGLERAPSMIDRSKLNLLVAAIAESQRITQVTLSAPHYSSADTVINGYTIPAGTTIMANNDSILLTGDAWEDPLSFKPERFLDAEGNLVQPQTYIPFGIGRRACPGEPLAKMELFLFLSALIQRFEMKPSVAGELPSLEPVPGLALTPKPFQIRFVDRQCL